MYKTMMSKVYCIYRNTFQCFAYFVIFLTFFACHFVDNQQTFYKLKNHLIIANKKYRIIKKKNQADINVLYLKPADLIFILKFFGGFSNGKSCY